MIRKKIDRFFDETSIDAEFYSYRIVTEKTQRLEVRQNVLQPVTSDEDSGVMVTLRNRSGSGYAGTSVVTEKGLQEAVQRADRWASLSGQDPLIDYSSLEMNSLKAGYKSRVDKSWDSSTLDEKIKLLMTINHKLKCDDRIVDWSAGLTRVETEILYSNSAGANIEQSFVFLMPSIRVFANEGGETIRRSFVDRCHQGGLEILAQTQFHDRANVLAAEAIHLLQSDNCPSTSCDLILAPDQMMLQIHESIGHPLELDRILGDERNYAGTSFVTLDMLGSYQYGSELLNVTFDPTVSGELASYAADDEGTKARREYLIKDGILKRPIGGKTSQHRADISGVACTRASSWNRPPIDRMANINVETGQSTLEELISSVENGVLMETNLSWSIDDSRNKFQFGCEKGQLIQDGKLTDLVKNPGYRGVSSNFWRNLKGVSDSRSSDTYGTPYCGKGEPNQIIRVGHGSPYCLFSEIEVFGGDK